jgi:hypothetical protein
MEPVLVVVGALVVFAALQYWMWRRSQRKLWTPLWITFSVVFAVLFYVARHIL